MMYKDKEKQREAIKKATQRYRAKKGDSALSSSKAVSQNAPESSVVDEVSDTQPVIPKCDTHVDASDIGVVKALHQGKEIKCITIGDQAKSMAMILGDTFVFDNDKAFHMTVMERLFYRPASKLKPGESPFVSLPGRACYGVN